MMILLQYEQVLGLHNLSRVLTISGRGHHLLFRLVGFCQAQRKQEVARFGPLFHRLLHYNLSVPVLTKKDADLACSYHEDVR